MNETPQTPATEPAAPSGSPPPEPPGAPATVNWTPALIFSALWTGICLYGLRIAWINGEAKGAGTLFQLAAALPLFYWAARLWRGSVNGWSERHTLALVMIAVALRCILIAAEPAQSDDIYRYLWEGRVQRAGENPFEHAPESEELAALRDRNWRLINHPEYTAIYPPLAQWSFLLVAAIHPSITAMKVFFTLCDLLTLLVLIRWLKALGRPPAWASLWAFHPLVIAEFSGNGHVDSLMALMVATSLWQLKRGREGIAILALAGAIAAKLIPLLLLPFFFWKLKRKALIVLPPALVILAYLPYAGAGEGLWASLWIYQRDWLFNAPLFGLARDVLFGTDGWLARYWFYGALGLIGAGLLFFRAGPAAAALPVMGFYQVAGPVVHPWYLCVFVALLCVRRRAWPWLWLTATAPLVYWGEAVPWVRALIWGPFLAGLMVAGVLMLRVLREELAAVESSD